MSIIGDIVGTVAKAVLPAVIDSVFPEASSFPTHNDPASGPASLPGLPMQPSGSAATIADHLSSFVATNGLHSLARQ